MKSSVKSFLVKIAFAVLFVAMFGMVIANVNLNKTRANEDPVFVLDGAYIRETDAGLADDTAVRFSVIFNQAFVDTIDQELGITLQVTINGTPKEVNVLEKADFSEGDYIFNVDLANFPTDAWQENIQVQAFAFDAVEGTQVDAIGSGLTRTFEYVAANAIVDGAEGLGEYVGLEGAIGYDDGTTASQGVETSDFNTAGNTEIALPGFDGDFWSITSIYVDGVLSTDTGLITEAENLADGVKVDLSMAGAIKKHVEHEVLVISGASGVHKTSFKYTDFAMSTKDELLEYFTYVGSNATNTSVYALVDGNIDCEKEYIGVRTQGTVGAPALDKCTFDGQGYTIDKLYVGKTSLFGTSWSNSMLRNVAFTHMGTERIEDGSLIWWGGNNNTIENVYIQALKKTSKGTVAVVENMAGLANSASGNYIKNCIFDIEFSGCGGTSTQSGTDADNTATGITLTGFGRNIIARTGNHANMTNVFGLSASAADLTTRQGYGTWVNSGMYHSDYDIYTAIHNNANAKAAFEASGCWNMENGAVVWATAKDYFTGAENTNVVGAVEYYKNKQDAFTVNLAKYGIEDVTSVTVEGTDVEFTDNGDGTITIAETALASSLNYAYYGTADRTIRNDAQSVAIVDSNGTESIIKVSVVDYAITNGEELREFIMTAWASNFSGNPNDVPGSRTKGVNAIYGVLLNNVDATGQTFNRADSTHWQGLLSGRGYTVSNVTSDRAPIDSHGAVTFENIAFVNWTFTGKQNMLAWRSYGVFKLYNTYWEINYAANSTERGLDRGMQQAGNMIVNTMIVANMPEAIQTQTLFRRTEAAYTPLTINFTAIAKVTGYDSSTTSLDEIKNNNSFYGACKYQKIYADVDAFIAGLDYVGDGTSADEHIDNWMKQTGLFDYDTTTTTSTDETTGDTVTTVTHNSIKWATAPASSTLKPTTVA